MNENSAITLRDVADQVTAWIEPISGKDAAWQSNSTAAMIIGERIEELFFKDVYPAAEAKNMKIEFTYSYDSVPTWNAYVSLATGHPGYDILNRNSSYLLFAVFNSHRKRKDIQRKDGRPKLCVASITVAEHGSDYSLMGEDGQEIPFEALNAEQFVAMAHKQLMNNILYSRVCDAAKDMLDAIQTIGVEQVQKIVQAKDRLTQRSALTDRILPSLPKNSIYNEAELRRLCELEHWIKTEGYRHA